MAEDMVAWSPYNYVFNNPMLLTDPTGAAPEPPNLKKVFKTLSKSKTFRKLAKRAGISADNINKHVSFSNENTHVVRITGKININKNQNSDEISGDLVFEISNRAHLKELHSLDIAVSMGGISPNQFAEKSLEIESKSISNEIIVTKEAGIPLTDNHSLATDFNAGNQSASDLMAAVKTYMSQNLKAFENQKGETAFDKYKGQGQRLQNRGKAITSRLGEKKAKKYFKKQAKRYKKIRKGLGIK